MLGNRFFLNTGIWTQNVLCKGEMNFNKRHFYIAINQNIRRVFEVTTDMANAMFYDGLLAWIAIGLFQLLYSSKRNKATHVDIVQI